MRFFSRGILSVVVGLSLLQTNAFGAPETKDSTAVQKEIIVKRIIPSKATIYSAVLPGLGQIYNKKTWKVPFIWGGFTGLIYMVNYYNNHYVNSKKAYFDLNDNSPDTKSYETTYPPPYFDYSTKAYFSQYSKTFSADVDKYRKMRDTYILYTAGFYLLNILDANVNAHLMDFDINEDLTFNFEPIMFQPITNTPILGGQITFTF